MSPKSPQRDHVPVDGEDEAFHGTNPWSGPYLLFAILAIVAVIMVLVIAGVLWQAA